MPGRSGAARRTCRGWSSAAGSTGCPGADDAERLADWLGAEYEPFGAHSHFGLVVGEQSYEQVADAIRAFLERTGSSTARGPTRVA